MGERPERNSRRPAEASLCTPSFSQLAQCTKRWLAADALWSGLRAPGAYRKGVRRGHVAHEAVRAGGQLQGCPMCNQRPTSFGVGTAHCTHTLNHQPPSLPSPGPALLCACVPHRWEPLQPCVSQPGQSSTLSSQGSESPRGGAGWPSFSFLQTLLRTLSPPPPSWGYRLMKRSFSSVICFVFLQSSDK